MEIKYEAASGCIKALAHPLRLKIIDCLKRGEKSVGQIENYCRDYTQSNISQHLSLMKGKGIISSTKKGNQVFYSISKKDLLKVLEMISRLFCRQ